jgi:hypothetical protein
MAEYRLGDHAAAIESLKLAAEKSGGVWRTVPETSDFYRAMAIFRQGKKDEARTLAMQAAARMNPIPKDERLSGVVYEAEQLLMWLTYKEAKKLIGFDAAPNPPR